MSQNQILENHHTREGQQTGVAGSRGEVDDRVSMTEDMRIGPFQGTRLQSQGDFELFRNLNLLGKHHGQNSVKGFLSIRLLRHSADRGTNHAVAAFREKGLLARTIYGSSYEPLELGECG